MPRGEKCRKVEDYQELVRDSLRRIFGDNKVKKEWDVAKHSRDDFTRELYCPRLDIAVGPFNVDRNISRNVTEIERILRTHRDFIIRMLRYSEPPVSNINEFLCDKNENPRCFLAIEIENSGSSKHMLGDIANASIIGSIGVIIPFNDTKLSLCKRIRKYVTFATNVEKIQTIFKNVLIINKENFLQVLNENKQGR